MTRGDALMDRGAAKLQHLSQRAATSGGVVSKLAEPLAEDAALLRRMKPSLIAARGASGDEGWLLTNSPYRVTAAG